MRYVPAQKPVGLKATLTAGRIQKVKFEIDDKTGKKLTESPEIPLADLKASWNWTPNEGDTKVLADEEDLVQVSARVFWFNPDGSGSGGYIDLDELTIFRDEIKVKALTADGTAVINAQAHLIVVRPGARPTKHTLSPGPVDDQGELTFSGLEHWDSIGVTVTGAWALQDASAPWRPGKDKGLHREVTVVSKKYKAAFKGIAREGSPDSEAIAESNGEAPIQFVNFNVDQRVPLSEAKERSSYYAHRVHIRVGPEADAARFAHDVIYVMFEAGENNSKRNHPKPALIGQDKRAEAQGILELRLNAQGEAGFDFELGYAGGDTFTLKICSVRDFSGTADQTLKFENWRKLFYELMAPAAMQPALSPSPLPLNPGSAASLDLPENVRDWLKRALDPVFIKYELATSHIFADSDAPSQLLPAAFFGREEPRNLFIAEFLTRKAPNASFNHPREDHTVWLSLNDVYYASAIARVPHALTLTSNAAEIAPSDVDRHFLPHFQAVTNNSQDTALLTSKIHWEAVIPVPENYANPAGHAPPFLHPGLDERGTPRRGELPESAVTATACNVVKVTLPAGCAAASLVGDESATKCPIKVTFTVREAQLCGGGYSDGQMVMTLNSRVDITGFLMGHEIGHSIGMTLIHPGDIPSGLDHPKNVDEGGVYYREPRNGETAGTKGLRTPGRGQHCATGLEAKGAALYPKEAPEGACIMYGYAPSRASQARTEPILFCAVCTEYVKALELTHLNMGLRW